MNIGSEIRELREARGLTITELAKMIGSTQSKLSLIERGKANPTLELLNRVARVFEKEVGLVSKEVNS